MKKIRCVKCGCVINTNAGYYTAFDGGFCRECWSKQSERFKREQLIKALAKRLKW